MKFMNKKIILLAITKDMKFYECFKDNLEFLGYSVFVFRSSSSITNKYLNYIKIISLNFFLNKNNSKALVIRPDLFSNKFLKKLIKSVESCYAYQWDGLSRYPKVISKIDWFKKFYVFDFRDTLNYQNVYQINNFFFDCYSKLHKNTNTIYDIYYVGSYDERINKIIQICEVLHKSGLKLRIKIPCNNEQALKLKQYKYIDTKKNNRTYKENLINVFKSKIILDFSHEKLHEGLSFRVFEALGYSKKIISTNLLIKKQDFYNKNNILVVESELNELDLCNFISNQYSTLDERIYLKYSFSSWFINQVLS